MPAQPIQANAAVERARARRAQTAGRRATRIEWFIKEVSETIEMTMKQRVTTATDLVKNKVIKNISTPVVKGRGPVSGRVVVLERSDPGEFPRADTTRLMKSIFSVVEDTMSGPLGHVATDLDYGFILETQMDRPFLTRTLREEKSKVTRILTGPIKG